MNFRLPMYARIVQATIGFGVFLLALCMWWRMFLWNPSSQRQFDNHQAWFLLAFVGSGVFVALASIFQATYRGVWPAVLMLFASASAAYMGLVALLLCYFSGHQSLIPMGYLYLLVVLLALVSSLVDAVIKLFHPSPRAVSNKSLDRSHGKRLSHQA